MEILLILFQRAKVDKDYADIIAGIFDGTLPSYKALKISFILKTILQGSMHIALHASAGILKGPEFWLNSSKETSLLAAGMLKNIQENPVGQVQWLAAVARIALVVSGHLIKNIRNQK
jgi:hypothetical protein